MTKTEANRIWLDNMNFRASREKYWKPKVYKNLLQMIRDATAFSSVQAAITNINSSIDSRPIAATIQAIYVDAGKVMGGRSYQSVKQSVQKALMPIGYNEDLVREIIAYFNANLLNKVVLPITDTMKDWILQKLIDGQQDGKSITQMVNEMLVHDFPRNRAFVITRTEVLRAANYGAMKGAEKTGYKMRKTWIAADDFRTRRLPRDAFSHRAMNGVTVAMSDPFQVPRKIGGYEELQQPGDPSGSAGDVIQCRCTVGFEVE